MTYKITVTMTDGTETEKTFTGLTLAWRWALMKIQTDGVQAVRIERKA